MKSIFFMVIGLLYGIVLGQDHRSFQQINDSILQEAHIIYRYDKAFTAAMVNVEANKEIRKIAGEILVMPQNETLKALVFSAEKPDFLVAEMRLENVLDSLQLSLTGRKASQQELAFKTLKHKVMNSVQAQYEINYGDKASYLNPIFIPFTETFGNKSINLYKLYLTTETHQSNTIPFGQDYLFYAKEDGSIFYNLQFNAYMPLNISADMVENDLVSISYSEKEPYITPTDIFLFTKYGTPKGINHLRVYSTNLQIFFDYNWDRETLDVFLE